MSQMTKVDPWLESVVAALKEVVGQRPVALHEPSFDGNEWNYLKQCLDSNYVSSIGKYVDQFEDELAKYTGAKFAVSVANGTSALQIALLLAGVTEGDEVIVPALTFIATANAVSYCGAFPHFADSENATLGIDANKLREYLLSISFQESKKCINKITGRVIRALVPMHTFGHPSDINGLLSVADEFHLTLIEDSAESLGSFYHGQHTGTFGLMGIFSFNGNKTITTGGGGAIVTNDKTLAKRAKHITTTAKIAHPWEFKHDEIGFNLRMPNLNAALGCAQLENLQNKLGNKRELFTLYSSAFKSVDGISLFNEPLNCKSNFWLQTLVLDEKHSQRKDEILQASNSIGISTRPAWGLLPSLLPYKNCQSMNLDGSRSLFARLINIPSSPQLV